MKKKSIEQKKSEIVNIIKELSSEDIDRLLFLVKIATPEQTEEFDQLLKRKDFKGNQMRQWIDSKRSLVMEVV